MPPISPRTQQLQMQNGAGSDQTSQLFEQGFAEMAQNVLLAKSPDLINQVVTFRVLSVDPDQGNGVGAFVLQRQSRMLYVPVILSSNLIKPLDTMYDKELNVFLPLSKGWMDELDKMTLGHMGQGIKTPDTLYSDVDIRNIVVPPITGRFSYASYIDGIESTRQQPRKLLLPFLERAPNNVKVAYFNALKRNKRVLKMAVSTYGQEPLAKALKLHTTKVAAKQNYGGALWIADKDTKAEDFQRVFGAAAPEAFTGVRLKGYAAKDTRKNLNEAIQVQAYSAVSEPVDSGVYRIHRRNGDEETALIIHNPIDLFAHGDRYAPRPRIPGHTNPIDRSYPYGRPRADLTERNVSRFLAVLASGDYIESDELSGEKLVADDLNGSTVHTRLFKDVKGEPKMGCGIFIRTTHNTFESTCPIRIQSITTGTDGVRRITAKPDEWGQEKTLIFDEKAHSGTFKAPRNSHVVMIPKNAIWIPLKEKLNPRDFFQNPMDLNRYTTDLISANNVKKATITYTREGAFGIDGGYPVNKVAALRTLAVRYHLPVDRVELLLEKVANDYRVDFYSMGATTLANMKRSLEKRADDAGPPKDKDKAKKPPKKDAAPPEEQDPNADPSMDSSMDPSMMGPPQPQAPPPPSPSDLAAMEMQQQIEAEMQKLQERSQMLQQLTMRTQEIATGAPVMPTVQTQAMGAPPPSVNMATGQPMGGGQGDPSMQDPSMMGPSMMDPSMAGQQGMAGMGGGGMDPSMQGMQGGMGGIGGGMGGGGMDPSMQGMQGGMGGIGGGMGGGDPSMQGGMGGGMGGMDPSMQGGMDPSMLNGMQDPSMGQQSPMIPMMTDDSLNTTGLESQISPQFLDQAAQLQDSDAFDAASIASLAQSPDLKTEVAEYVPNLTKALDNLGRILLTLRMQETELKKSLGDTTFDQLEERSSSTFEDLGDLVLSLNQTGEIVESRNTRPSA